MTCAKGRHLVTLVGICHNFGQKTLWISHGNLAGLSSLWFHQSSVVGWRSYLSSSVPMTPDELVPDSASDRHSGDARSSSQIGMWCAPAGPWAWSSLGLGAWGRPCPAPLSCAACFRERAGSVQMLLTSWLRWKWQLRSPPENSWGWHMFLLSSRPISLLKRVNWQVAGLIPKMYWGQIFTIGIYVLWKFWENIAACSNVCELKQWWRLTFLWFLLCTRNRSKLFTYVSLFNPHNNPRR